MGRRVKGKPIKVIKDTSIRKAIVEDKKNEIRFSASAVDETFGDITVIETEPVRRHARVPKTVDFDHIEGGQFIITRKDRKGEDISQTAILIQPNIEKEVEKLEIREKFEKGLITPKTNRKELRRIAKVFNVSFTGGLTPKQLFNRIEKAVLA